MVTVTLLDVGDPRWAAFLDGAPHDFYHLPGYVDVSVRHQGGRGAALYATEGDGRMLLPLVIRDVATGGGDAISPYGYPGPLVLGTDDPAFMARALTEGVRLLRDEGLISMFVRLHPLLNQDPPAGIGTLVRHGETVTVDLSQSVEALWHDTRPRYRTAINQSIRAGYVARVDSDGRGFDAFKALYRATMIRKAAAAFYLFDDTYFERLRDALGERLVIGLVELDGVVAAAGMFVETCGIVQYHLSGTDERYATHAPTRLLHHFFIQWARQRGDRWLHLGGGRGGANDSLMQYKAGFSSGRTPFHTLRVVLDEPAYTRLVASRDPSLDASDRSGYFPLYRSEPVMPAVPSAPYVSARARR